MFDVKQNSDNEIFIQMNSDTAHIEALTELVQNFSEKYISTELAYKIVIAVDEAITNIIIHGYHNQKDKQIFIRLKKIKDEIIIEIENFGEKFIPPLIVEKKKFSFDKLEEGGLGLYLMQEFMDELRFLYDREHGKNILVMKKYIFQQ